MIPFGELTSLARCARAIGRCEEAFQFSDKMTGSNGKGSIPLAGQDREEGRDRHSVRPGIASIAARQNPRCRRATS